MSHPFYALLDPYNADTIAIDETLLSQRFSAKDGDQQVYGSRCVVFSCEDLVLTRNDRAGIVKHESFRKLQLHILRSVSRDFA
jgi:hypothetical protein